MIKFTTSADFSLEDASPARAAFEKVKADSMSGWLAPWNLLNEGQPESELSKIHRYASKIQSDSDYLVCIGIGGSYLGHKAVLDALDGEYESSRTKILYAGNSLSSYALKKIINTISDHDFSLNIISKSGTTIEPNLAFEILKSRLEEKYGPSAADRIYATTDASRGALHDEAVKNHYHRLIVPDSVGGRYSVLTSVGLLPIAAAGVNIDELLAGAKSEAEQQPENAFHYATLRAALAQEGFSTEIFATFEPRLANLNEWLKQLFGESEGKNRGGIFPASVIYSTDLHSLGQYLQDGRRDILETFIKLPESAESDFPSLDSTNRAAEAATISAHRTGGIPILEISYPNLSARSLGALLYFFELSCAISATLQGANPFDQPGVELYKSNLRELLRED